MRDFDLHNIFEAIDSNVCQRRQERLVSLQHKAILIAAVTGQRPVTYYEFLEMVPKQPGETFKGISVGAFVGSSVGFAIGAIFAPLMIPAVIGGALVGGIAEAAVEHSRHRAGDPVEEYAHYLERFELEV